MISYISCVITVRDIINQNITREQLTERLEFCQQFYDECLSNDSPIPTKHKAKGMLEAAKEALDSYDKYWGIIVL